uniref:Guanylate cyclase activator 2B n=1 Tax=Mus spicilegus TaxID=10103 RepID=A0A8C6GUQ5_MUSSI
MRVAGLVSSAPLGSQHSHSVEGTLEEPRGNSVAPYLCSPTWANHRMDSLYHGFQVQLESVKKLNELEEKQMSNPQPRRSGLLPAVCHNPALPLDLQPVCASQEAASTFKALRTIATDECELCINVACTGC